MLVSKYRPRKVSEIIGNDNVKQEVVRWLLRWLKGEKQKPILLWGPSGIGKTSLALAIAEEHDLQLVELNASEMRDKANMERIVGGAMLSSQLFGKGKLILIDDVDAMAAEEDRGGVAALALQIKHVNAPVILTAENYWDRKIAPLRTEVHALEMKRVSPGAVASFLKEISKKEKIGLSEKEINEIAKNCEGDVRSALNDLEIKMQGKRDRKKEIFEVMKTIFKSSSFSEIARVVWMADVDHDLLKLWIDQNIPIEYESRRDVGSAYNWLSRADVFDGRIIKRQCWDFLRYSTSLMSAGVGFAKEKPYIKFTKYQYPTYMRKMTQTMIARRMRKAVFLKLGRKVHLSSKRASEMAEIFKEIAKKSKEEFLDFYRLDEEEIEFLTKL
ncbi:MAG: replication factor C large subunit [Candidatus Anstonellales archaeon]